ncbi:DNA methyltransferase [Rothia aeria]|uniref:DNA methyltransferase n=1 Tax=Rothia aeria TaxID=172042 RepID=UPI0028D7B15B|nr:DNA methyltransferase [Rothia aeria]
MRLSVRELEERVGALAGRNSQELLYDLLTAYGRSASSMTRLRKGDLNVARHPEKGEVAQKNVVYFRPVPHQASTDELLELMGELTDAEHVTRYSPRFVLVTDYHRLLAYDTRTRETLSTPLAEIGQHVAFFLPWAGMEKTTYISEHHADRKAADKMAVLFDELLKVTPSLKETAQSRHNLNTFFSRLLFCFFAEDTEVFSSNQFTNAVGSLTLTDGSDTHEVIAQIFAALDAESREDKPAVAAGFPYVNGRLFAVQPGQYVPVFNARARSLLLELGALQWGDINPDIFGSMFQSVIDEGQRANLGQHYTSVPNILKTIEPLFLDDLKDQLAAAEGSPRRLQKLLERIARIKVFDPACGSGNFLVIAYKELRKLEHTILEKLQELSGDYQSQLLLESRIRIENFYGIEIDDFPAEIAVLSLWIAKHQMNVEFKQKFGTSIPLIPLREAGAIRCGNAARLDWQEVCPNNGEEEIYLIGNPPYVGSSMQTKEQKADFPFVFGKRKYAKSLDYVSLWFVSGADYIAGTRAQLAFVSTNSVVQGDHVALLFPHIFDQHVEIGYAYHSFKWTNNAKGNAGVTVIVLSLRPEGTKSPKYIFSGGVRTGAKNINGYLLDAPNIILESPSKPICKDINLMVYGNKPVDGGNLFIADKKQLDNIISSYPESGKYIRPILGSAEFINGKDRWCLWITDEQAEEALKIPAIAERAERVRQKRLESTKKQTLQFAEKPWRFVEARYQETDKLIVPRVSSERREYIPIGYLGPDTVISDSAFAVYGAEPWLFALLTSRMHMVWTRTVGGRMKTDYRYSNTVVYNNFPVPDLSARAKSELTDAALRVLDVREYHSEMTLAQLYDPDTMPQDLRIAHEQLDLLVDSLYRDTLFASDDERLKRLFTLYLKQTGGNPELF